MSDLDGSKRKTGKKRTRAKRCKHTHANFTMHGGETIMGCYSIFVDTNGIDADFGYSPGRVVSARCHHCGAQLSLGESDEAPVAMEIYAAEIELWSNYDGLAISIEAPDELDGWCGRTQIPIEIGPSAGWLAAEIFWTKHDPYRDATAWPWDPTRPIKDQYALWQHVVKMEEALDVEAALDDLDSTDSDAPTLASTTPLLAIATAGVEAWICPVESQECAIRRKCTNKCGAAEIEESLAHLESDPADSRVQVTITLGPPEDLETMLDGEPLIEEQTRHDVAASYVRHDDIETGGEG